MGRNAVVGPLSDDAERTATLRIAKGKVEKDHRRIAMCRQIALFQLKRIQHTQKLFAAFGHGSEPCARFLPSVQNHAALLAEIANLMGIDKFQMFKDRNKDQGRSLSKIDKRETKYLMGLPEIF